MSFAALLGSEPLQGLDGIAVDWTYLVGLSFAVAIVFRLGWGMGRYRGWNNCAAGVDVDGSDLS